LAEWPQRVTARAAEHCARRLAEPEQVIGGLFFMRAGSIDEAVAWSKSTAFAKLGILEIRGLWLSPPAIPGSTSTVITGGRDPAGDV